jgi:hypothetical protein
MRCHKRLNLIKWHMNHHCLDRIVYTHGLLKWTHPCRDMVCVMR